MRSEKKECKKSKNKIVSKSIKTIPINPNLKIPNIAKVVA
jgi:hypothetical protein